MKTVMIAKKKLKSLVMKNKLLFFFILTSFQSFSQTNIKGLVSSETNQLLPFVNIVLQDSLNVIVAYTYSSEKGLYNLKTSKKGNFKLKFSYLGFESIIISIVLKENVEITKNITLKEVPYSLDEVIIITDKPISIKKDTITFKANRYLQGNEAVIEDLLKKIPGVTVNSEGTIKIGNQEIEKLMIDGDDFFDRGYKILSKNMPPDQIDKIELLQKYSNNKLLKGVEESDKVALNLVLKEDAKRKWFGNFALGYDATFNNRYSIKSYLMNFGKKSKYIFLTNFNNIGYNATGDINHLIRPFRNGEPASIGDNQQVYSLLNLNAFTPNFKTDRTNFNNTELVSLNAIFTLSKKVKLKTLGFFNWDENDFFRNSTQTFTSNGTDFTNTEDFTLRKKKFVGFGKIDLNYDISKTKTLEFITKYNNQEGNNTSNLLFNNEQTIENLKNRNTLFDQKIVYTNKFKKNKVLLLTGRYIDEKTPQNYAINQFFYTGLFPSFSNTNNVEQLSENKMQFAGFEAHLLDRKENGNLLELKFGNQYRKDRLLSSFNLKENNTILDTPIDYQNNLTYTTNDLYFNTKYRIKVNNFGMTGNLEFHQLSNQTELIETKEQTPFYINPKLNLDWEVNNKNKLFLSYAVNTTNARIIDIYDNFVLTNFRGFNKGTNSFNQLTSSNITFNYQLGNWSDKFFANTSIVYNNYFDYFSSQSIITQNYSQSERILIKNRNAFTVFSDVNRYFKAISSNFKLGVSYTKSNYENRINNSDLREIKFTNYAYGFELRSGFQGVFNYHFGSKWTTNEIQSPINNSFTNNVSFMNLSFDLSDKFDIELENERYYFDNIDNGNNTYYFSDIELRYRLKKNKINVSLSGKNLFNTDTFKTFSISDISTSTTEFRLLPRYILLKMEYRF
jgi:hypothetical protein